MTKIPIISGEKAIRVFQKIGYQVIRQRGSHIRLYHTFDPTKISLTIPNHKVLGKELLRKLLRDAELTVEEFLRLLRR